MTIYNEYLKQCVEDCSALDGNWQNPSDLTDPHNYCECIPGYLYLSDGSCYDCSLVDADCFSCSVSSQVFSCTECNSGLYLDKVGEDWCHPYEKNCIIEFDKQPALFVAASSIFPDVTATPYAAKKICP